MFTGSGSWTVQVDLDRLSAGVRIGDRPTGPTVVAPEPLSVRSGWIWSTVIVDAPQAQLRAELKGLANDQGRSLEAVLGRARQLGELRGVLDAGNARIVAWAQGVQEQARQWASRWWPRELVATWVGSRPTLDPRFEQARQAPELQAYLSTRPMEIREAVAWWDTDLARLGSNSCRRHSPRR